MGTEMFHFPTFPPHRLYIQRRVTRHNSCWVSPFGHPRITARLTAPRGLSQPPTSFIGSWYQGIHRTPLHTYNNTYTHTPTHKGRHTNVDAKNINAYKNHLEIAAPQQGPKKNFPTSHRCSHPLCNSQTTHTDQPHTTQADNQPAPRQHKRVPSEPR